MILFAAFFPGFLLALAAGWFFWGRPLNRLRLAHEMKSEALGKTTAEYTALRESLETIKEKAAAAERYAIRLAEAETALRERQQSAAAAAEESARQHEAQLQHLRDEFQHLAGLALERAQIRFTEQAAETLKLHRAEAEKGLTQNQAAFATLLQPMRDTLGRYETELKAIEQKREQAYGGLDQQLKALSQSEARVREEAGKIIAALRGSAKTSGAWGEARLKRVLELAGLTEGIDFELQETATDTEGKRRRPDAILKMPGGRELIIDSKCSLDAYIKATEAESETSRRTALAGHATRVREHVKGLASKAYWDEFGAAADFVLLFMPGDNFLTAAMEQDRDLHAFALQQRVLLVGPTMLLAVARVVSMVWRQETMAEEARRIGSLGTLLYERLVTMTEHINKVGKNIDNTARSWNSLVGSIESRLLVTGREFAMLGVNGKEAPLSEPRRVETSIRYLHVEHPEGKTALADKNTAALPGDS